MECNICLDLFNKNIKKKVICFKCNYEVCRKCNKQYILNLNNFAQCMNCKVEWDRKFIYDNFSKQFNMKEYKIHKENIYYNMEVALFPETQQYIQLDNINIKIKKLIQLIQFKKIAITIHNKALNIIYNKALNINPLNNNILKYIYEIKENKFESYYDFKVYIYQYIILNNEKHNNNNNIQLYIKIYNEQIFRLNNYYNTITINQIENIDNIINEILNININTNLKEISIYSNKINNTKNFHIKCMNNNCKGFLSSKWKCGLCETYTCNKCFLIKKDKEHICKQEDIETTTLIKKDSKPCPNCGIIIYKISGCNTMFCTQCKKSFCWRTGCILTKNLHNPHYNEYIRNNNINNIDICNEIPYINNKKLNEIYRKILHINDINFHAFDLNQIEINKHIRKQYLLNKIDKKKFKYMIQKNYKRIDKYYEIQQNIRLLYDTTKAIIMNYINNNNINYEIQLNNLINYINKQFKNIKEYYNMSIIYNVNDEYKFISLNSFCNKCNIHINKKYKHCDKCNKCNEPFNNKHCDICNKCVNKYVIHCALCNKCVNKYLIHCNKCNKCVNKYFIHCEKCNNCVRSNYCNICNTQPTAQV